MRVGLLRHFPVTQPLPSGWQTAADLQSWRERYDLAEAIVGAFDLGGVDWQACITSDMQRAYVTARHVFSGAITQTALLREPEFAQFRTGRLRLPMWTWRWVLRLSWMTGHSSQAACRDDFQRRVLAIADLVCNDDRDLLVVSHAGMMAYLSRELRRRGFVGPKLRIADHATAYIFEKPGR